jgi:hypothetical protein
MITKKAKDTLQWQLVRKARAEQRVSASFPVLESLEEAWLHHESVYGFFTIAGQKAKVVDRDALEGLSETPFSTLMLLTEMGFYPPPELLLGLLGSWRDYLKGDQPLEEALLGKPKRKAGNYANRYSTALSRMRLSQEFSTLVDAGNTQEVAAEIITSRYGLRIDAESFIRMARKSRLFRSNGKNKRGKNPGKPMPK